MQRRGFMKTMVALAALPLISKLGFAQDIIAKADQVDVKDLKQLVSGHIRYMGTLNLNEFERPIGAPQTGDTYRAVVDESKTPFHVYPTGIANVIVDNSFIMPYEVSYLIVKNGDMILYDGREWVALLENTYTLQQVRRTAGTYHRNGATCREMVYITGRVTEPSTEQLWQLDQVYNTGMVLEEYRTERPLRNRTGIDQADFGNWKGTISLG